MEKVTRFASNQKKKWATVAWKGLVEYSDHGRSKEAPGEELQEDDHQSVVQACLAQTSACHYTLHLLCLETQQNTTVLYSLLMRA